MSDSGLWQICSLVLHSVPLKYSKLTNASSTVIRDLDEICDLDPSKRYAYWYFEFGFDATQSVVSLMRSLIRQLSQPPLPSSVVNLWKKHHLRGSEPDSAAVKRVLDDVLARIPKGNHVYLVFDALDECPNNNYPSERESLLSLLMDLLERHKDKVHILATSRSEKDISQGLVNCPNVDLEELLAEDVKTFVDVALSRRLGTWNDAIRNMIRDKLLSFKERCVISFSVKHIFHGALLTNTYTGVFVGPSCKLKLLANNTMSPA